MKYFKIVALSLICFTSFLVSANEVDIVMVKAVQDKNLSWRFAVTLKHDDEGWEHYANKWQVIAPDNKILATRTLYHPHVKEQPFTRNTQGVKIPANLKSVRIIAYDTVHGLSTKIVEINLKTQKLTIHHMKRRTKKDAK